MAPRSTNKKYIRKQRKSRPDAKRMGPFDIGPCSVCVSKINAKVAKERGNTIPKTSHKGCLSQGRAPGCIMRKYKVGRLPRGVLVPATL